MQRSGNIFVGILLSTIMASAQSAVFLQVPNASSVTYRLSHTFHTIEATSKDVVFRLTADPSTRQVLGVSAVVDVTTFDSGNSNRDSHAMEVLDAITFPEVRFTSTGFTQRGDSLFVRGTLLFHGESREIMATALARWEAGNVKVTGSFPISLTEFKVPRPALLMIPVADRLDFSFQAAFGQPSSR